MRYIILGAGKGTRLHPLTLNIPKCLFSIDDDYSIAQRIIDQIYKYDKNAEIVYVVGFMADEVMNKINKHLVNSKNSVKFIRNPFYDTTNSISSLWFAKDYLYEEVCIINGDIVTESSLIKNIVTQKLQESAVLIDSSVRTDGDYNVQVNDEKIVVMSKELNEYYGEYSGITKLIKKDSQLLKNEIETMINNGLVDQWYENALVQLIFNRNYVLKYVDITNYNWTEVDCVDDLINARRIHSLESRGNL